MAEWTLQLERARTAAEFQAIAEAVLGDGRSALGALHQFLECAAEWCDKHEPDLAARYRSGASELAQLGAQLADLGEDHLARTYAPTPQARPGQVPPPPPQSPAAGRNRSR
ncbi:hypothetical protein RM572_26540 [Streptomyces sp. DSM 42041]|uniref:Excreted virulence factor EspC (Type VII ESX diderm) n=1 Tax=Streptomyces hazeniae TaxID=3075538 RepID=A0ABU2P2C1_9ACTN|nr:hypothetical protein [Streptomyces sp. DSM 42041]MDT0382322.1 hypothetical protein [Streptomyces sp. DSM 42041]